MWKRWLASTSAAIVITALACAPPAEEAEEAEVADEEAAAPAMRSTQDCAGMDVADVVTIGVDGDMNVTVSPENAVVRPGESLTWESEYRAVMSVHGNPGKGKARPTTQGIYQVKGKGKGAATGKAVAALKADAAQCIPFKYDVGVFLEDTTLLLDPELMVAPRG